MVHAGDLKCPHPCHCGAKTQLPSLTPFPSKALVVDASDRAGITINMITLGSHFFSFCEFIWETRGPALPQTVSVCAILNNSTRHPAESPRLLSLAPQLMGLKLPRLMLVSLILQCVDLIVMISFLYPSGALTSTCLQSLPCH